MNIRATAKSFRLRFLSAFAAWIVVCGATASAAEDPTYLAEYKLYMQALKQQDLEGATAHGKAAWRAAEAELGDNELTAVLAYNYGQLVLFDDTESAVEALRRADELQKSGVADLPASELRLYLAYAEFRVGGGKRRQANELREALKQVEAEGAAANDLATMWLQLAWSDINGGSYKHAIESASKAETAINASAPENYHAKAEAILIGGVATLLPRRRTIEDILNANREFARARELFPLQKDLEGFDHTLAQILAWNVAAYSALLTFKNYDIDLIDLPTASRIKVKSRTDKDDIGEFLWIDMNTIFDKKRANEECLIHWADRKIPKYPKSELNRGTIGAVLIGYNFGNGLNLLDPRILAEAPAASDFGESVLKAMADWRLAEPTVNHPDCRRNFLLGVPFILSPD